MGGLEVEGIWVTLGYEMVGKVPLEDRGGCPRDGAYVTTHVLPESAGKGLPSGSGARTLKMHY